MLYMSRFLKKFNSPIVLLLSILMGGITGHFLGHYTLYLKPFGDIFLNLIFVAIVPLIFFSVSSAIGRINFLERLGKIFLAMMIVFLFTSAVAAIYMIIIMKIFPPLSNITLLNTPAPMIKTSFLDQITGTVTVGDFSRLFSHNNILALIIFSILVGIATSITHKKGNSFINFLQSGEEIFMQLFSLIMYYAPIGFFTYFAVMVNQIGPKFLSSYLQIAVIYYSFSLLFFVCFYTLYAYLADKKNGISLFWRNLFLPLITSIATCSSAACIPANLIAVKKMKVPKEIAETVIPLGTIIHKDGSVMGGVIKIAFLFSLFHLPFSGTFVFLTAFGVALLVGTVMGAIPSGGMLGELLILNAYGFPASVLIPIAAISIIIDPLATMINVTGNSISCMLITKLVKK